MTRLTGLLVLLASIHSACDRAATPARIEDPSATHTPRVETLPRALRARWVGEPTATMPALVLLHGYGAPGDDLVPVGAALRRRLGEQLNVALLEAPISLGGNARAWWPIALRERPADRGADSPSELAEARRDVIAWLEAERDLGHLDSGRTVLAGFSQGAMLSVDVALEWSESLAGVGMLSGGPIDEARWRRRVTDGRVRALWASHGRQDGMLRFDAAERVARLFEQSNVPVEFVAFEGGHEITASVKERFAQWLQTRLH